VYNDCTTQGEQGELTASVSVPTHLFWLSGALDSALTRKQIDRLTQARWDSNRIPTQWSIWSIPTKRDLGQLNR